MVLCKLATILIDIHRENGKWVSNEAQPLTLVVNRPETNMYLSDVHIAWALSTREHMSALNLVF